MELLTSAPRAAQAEVLTIRRRLADAVQSLGWYAGDLDDLNAGGIGHAPRWVPGLSQTTRMPCASCREWAPAPSRTLTGTASGSSG